MSFYAGPARLLPALPGRNANALALAASAALKGAQLGLRVLMIAGSNAANIDVIECESITCMADGTSSQALPPRGILVRSSAHNRPRPRIQ